MTVTASVAKRSSLPTRSAVSLWTVAVAQMVAGRER